MVHTMLLYVPVCHSILQWLLAKAYPDGAKSEAIAVLKSLSEVETVGQEWQGGCSSQCMELNEHRTIRMQHAVLLTIVHPRMGHSPSEGDLLAGRSMDVHVAEMC